MNSSLFVPRPTNIEVKKAAEFAADTGNIVSITLDNCADEPIHKPGQIQPHGTVLVFNAALDLVAWAANAQAMLGLPVAPFLHLGVGQITPSIEVMQLVLECHKDMVDGETAPMVIEAWIGGKLFDCIAHAYRHRVLVEFELRQHHTDSITGQVLRGQRSYDRLKRQKTVQALLQMAVEQVRELTGFDRVMAYRFRQDDSGEILAEARLDTLVPYLGQRYPASDIPAQARRLYVLNTLRLIADVNYEPVHMCETVTEDAIDLSHSVLRSVSPVHVEYLQNMGVAASMSVSILVNGRLWGMLACHHMNPKQVPYAIRLSCDVLAQVLSSTAQGLEANAQALMLSRASTVRSALLQALLDEDDLASALERHADDLRDVFGAGALVLAQNGKLKVHGELSESLASTIIASLPQHSDTIIRRERCSDWPEQIRGEIGKWVGALALSFNPAGNGWLLILRVEQLEEVRWGGKPEKAMKSGPLGMRLTPRGSFDAWAETIRGQCEPWDEICSDTATLMLAELHRFNLFRLIETDRVRALLLAMLGHDLRDPLQAIQMAASLLQREEQQERLGRRIQSSGARMQRLIAQVLDMSVLQGNAALALNTTTVDLIELVADIVDESRVAHPNVSHVLDLPPACLVQADADRLAQVLTNLISNALHHGSNMRPIQIRMRKDINKVSISVLNESDAIGEAAVGMMFDPYKATSLNNFRNPGGMGIGLYIVREIMAAHHGTVSYRYVAPHVIFEVELPLSSPSV